MKTENLQKIETKAGNMYFLNTYTKNMTQEEALEELKKQTFPRELLDFLYHIKKKYIDNK